MRRWKSSSRNMLNNDSTAVPKHLWPPRYRSSEGGSPGWSESSSSKGGNNVTGAETYACERIKQKHNTSNTSNVFCRTNDVAKEVGAEGCWPFLDRRFYC